MHPGSRILIYVLAALAIPGLPFFPVVMLLTAALLAIAWLGRHPQRLIWRTRWLLLVLILGYGYGVPGQAALAILGDWAPTAAGLIVGVERALHLMALLLWLDVLVLSLSGQQLLAGLHALMRPWAALGVDTGRMALRLSLTLKAIERLERGEEGAAPSHGVNKGRGNLRRLFDPAPGAQVPEHIVLMHYPVRGRDVWVPVLLLACLGVMAWSGAWR